MKQNVPGEVLVDDCMPCWGLSLNKTPDAPSLCQIINKRNGPIPL